eukprot:6004378-Pyramimonas_sp.AAC.1
MLRGAVPKAKLRPRGELASQPSGLASAPVRPTSSRALVPTATPPAVGSTRQSRQLVPGGELVSRLQTRGPPPPTDKPLGNSSDTEAT